MVKFDSGVVKDVKDKNLKSTILKRTVQNNTPSLLWMGFLMVEKRELDTCQKTTTHGFLPGQLQV